jgi:hypothetical protein
MDRVKRVLMTAGAAALAAALVGCGGLGINLKSGGSGANTATEVAITATSGVTVNPYPVEVGHTTRFVAHPSSGNSLNYEVVEPVVWNTSMPLVTALLESDCVTPYAGEQETTICVQALVKGSSIVNATTVNGAVGSIGVTVTL